jgi:hypothetical protein
MVRPRWLGVDVVCVLVFCALRRRSHDEGINVAGIATTAWPFLSGIAVWLCTVAVGMLLRTATSAGVVTSFVVVASSVTALLLLGWRAATVLASRCRSTT